MNSDILPTAVGYSVFGLLSIVAIIYIVKFSIEIDRENYRNQLMSNNNGNYSGTLKPNMNNVRMSPSVDNNSSFSSQPDYNRQLPYISSNNTLGSNQLAPHRLSTLPSPKSPSSISQLNNYIPSNNYQSSQVSSQTSYNNRQSRQYLLKNY
ncbi:hypothetical protein BCR36DRAFT_585679 [Piromyces finnis]|uniref:Uncharacterized protein n=1 Tax=Piromyces finnis TaxID=1754191 RepID=A0A1Y1V1Q9_9FUNG|nr:hypothetical protein BCR36DRAFT_585679 [Piromyces finnis]|eukprot:ORX45372.1 hypothetical protein BCR36DRAFT_585679 [Piromyces finnis]